MRIVCDLRSTIIPPLLDLLEDCHRPDCLPLLRFPAPVVYTKPTQTDRREAEDDA